VLSRHYYECGFESSYDVLYRSPYRTTASGSARLFSVVSSGALCEVLSSYCMYVLIDIVFVKVVSL
jgi:hypothetical protein